MYDDYIDNIRSKGRRDFTSEDVRKDLNVSDDAARAGLYRLKKEGKIISPLKGFYVIVPPEDRPYGSIRAAELTPLIMKHLKADYYVGLLSGAAYFGATHQKPARFQVVSNKRIKHSLKFGKVIIELIYKHSLSHLPIKDFVVSTGYLKVAAPELTALDIFTYSEKSAGISHIATVLSELIEAIDPEKLIALAENTREVHHLQRIGYILERIDVMDEEHQKKCITILSEYVAKAQRSYVTLVPYRPKTGFSRCKKWKIIENTDFESDL